MLINFPNHQLYKSLSVSFLFWCLATVGILIVLPHVTPHFQLRKSPARYQSFSFQNPLSTLCFRLVPARLYCVNNLTLQHFSVFLVVILLFPFFPLSSCLISALIFTLDNDNSSGNPGLYFRPSDYRYQPLPEHYSWLLPCLWHSWSLAIEPGLSLEFWDFNKTLVKVLSWVCNWLLP